MKVSVAMITYNHKRFIAQAIESVLMQQVTFDLELVIGEDCSTDGTREIVLKYQKKYPGKIRLLLPEKNLGVNRNFSQTILACSGQYIALLEGDDYWTSPEKLQRQVEIMDAHHDYAICCHNVIDLKDECPQYSQPRMSEQQKDILTIEDLIDGWVAPTCSALIRRELVGEFPKWFFSLQIGELPFYILLLKNTPTGKIKYLNELMAVYRIHGDGVWSSASEIQRLKYLLGMYLNLSANLKEKYQAQASAKTLECLYTIAVKYLQAGNLSEAKPFLGTLKERCGNPYRAVRSLNVKGVSPKQALKTLAVIYNPNLYCLFSVIKTRLHR